MTTDSLLTFASHIYAVAALAYLAMLLRPLAALAWVGRALVAGGLVVHGLYLLQVLNQEVPVLSRAEGLAAAGFVTLFIFLGLELFYRRPVLGAFVTPLAVGVLLPAASIGQPVEGSSLHGPLLSVHIGLAVLGLAAFAVAAAVAGMYLLMEREARRKRFGLIFERLPSLQFLDDLHRRLGLVGFVVLSLTLLSGAYFARATPLESWSFKAVATVLVWLVFGLLLQARMLGGWKGRRLAVVTMAGFGILLVSFFGSYVPVAVGS